MSCETRGINLMDRIARNAVYFHRFVEQDRKVCSHELATAEDRHATKICTEGAIPKSKSFKMAVWGRSWK